MKTLKDKLVFIAFLLEPEVDKLMVQFTETDAIKYAAEHEQCDQYYNSVVSSD